jgi:putative photosynthetic complex assembly protein 2
VHGPGLVTVGMIDFGMSALYAVLVWWFATGIILFLDGLPRSTFRWSMGAATALLAIVAVKLHSSAGDLSAAGAYASFTCAIGVWGWLEMSFLMGFITGPRKHACLECCSGWRHFLHASEAIIFNELATLVGAVVILAATHRAPNQTALGTYLILWSMRLSAKLNLFLGVPNLGEKFLPPHLQYLKSFFRKRPMNLLFPISVTLSTIGVVLLVQRYLAVTDPFRTTAYALMASLLALAVLEHWFMVIPLPSEKMWKWAMRPPAAGITAKVP